MLFAGKIVPLAKLTSDFSVFLGKIFLKLYCFKVRARHDG